MALNPNGSNDTHRWNYSNPDNPGFSLSLTGTVVAIQEVQAMSFAGPGQVPQPQTWDDSRQPKMNIRIVLCGEKGGYRTLTFQPASKAQKEGKKRSIHLDLFNLAGGRDMMDLLGKTIKITTENPPANFSYGQGNPRPWFVELVTDAGPFQLKEPLDPKYLIPYLLANAAVSGGMVQAPVPVAAPQMGAPAAPMAAPAPAPEEEDLPF